MSLVYIKCIYFFILVLKKLSCIFVLLCREGITIKKNDKAIGNWLLSMATIKPTVITDGLALGKPSSTDKKWPLFGQTYRWSYRR